MVEQKQDLKVLDLFCGCGGLSQGFIDAGYDVVLGLDSSKDAIDTFKANHQSSQALICDLFIDSPSRIIEQINIEKIDVIIGGPPCQGFSIAGKQLLSDERNTLYRSFVEFVRLYSPKAFVLENVPNILSINTGKIKEEIISDFESLGYKVVCSVLLASNYGVPQNRKRAFFVGLKNNKEFIFPTPMSQPFVTASDAISDLPSDSITDGTPYPCIALSSYQKLMREKSTGIYNHKTANHNESTIKIISMVPDGGNFKSLPEEFKKTRNVNIAWTRLHSQKPSFTIDTGHRHHFHYKFNRIPTVREAARLQSFPDKFIFLGSNTAQNRQVGNAVPPILAKVLAEKLLEFI